MSFKEVDEKESEEEELEEEEEEELEETRAPPKPVTTEYMPKVKEGPLLFELPRGKVSADFKEEDLELMAEKEIPEAWRNAGQLNKDRILVVNSEQVDTVFKADGTVDKIEGTGSIGFYNPNEKNRVWDVDSYWENIDKTDLAKGGLCHIDIYELEPDELRVKEYGLKEIKPLLRIDESVNTAPGKKEGPRVLIKDKETTAEIMVRVVNLSKKKLENVTVVKELGKLGKPTDIQIKVGKYELEDNKIVWSGCTIDPEGSRSMTFKVAMSPEATEPFKTGQTSATFNAPDTTVSGIAFLGVDGYTKNVTWVDRDELEKSPGRWDCEIEFENLSTFEVLLREVEVYRETAEETLFKKRSDRRQQLIVDEERLDITLSPDTENKWAKKFVFPDPKEDPIMQLPSFGQRVFFSVKNMFLREITGSAVHPAGEVTVADLELEKSYDLEEVSAVEEKLNMTTLKACNTGSAQLNTLVFEEKIPKEFDVNPDSFKAYLVRPGADKRDITKAAKFDIRDKDVKKERNLRISFMDLDDVEAIKPKDCVEVNYGLFPMNPEPGVELVSPVEAIGNVSPPFPTGEELRVTAEAKLTVKPYVWRKVRVGKSIKEGTTKGEYDITVYYKNKLKPGEIALVTDDEASLPDITIRDILPEGFNLTKSDPEVTDQTPRMVEGKSFTVLEWSIQDIRPDQMVEISYTIKGEPGATYKARNAQALLTA